MAHPVLSLWLLVAGLWPPACGQEAPDEESSPPPVTTLVSSSLLNNSQFAFNLYRQLMDLNSRRNLLFSPLSFTIPLTFLALQTNPEARNQILRDLGFPLADVWGTEVYTHYSDFLKTFLVPVGQCFINTGSVLFVDHRQDPMEKLVQLAQNLYNTDIVPIYFKNSRIATHQIDFIMQQKTHGKITRLLQEVQPHSNLILANYIFYKGEWNYLFNPKLTEIRPFTVSKKIVIPVSMMHRLGWFQVKYLHHLYSYVLRLPHTCNITAIFILPEEGMITEAEKVLVKGNFSIWAQPLPISRWKLYLPRLSISGNIEANKLMLSPGGADIFSYKINLSGISLEDNNRLKVNKVVQRVELTLDEEGATEEDVINLKSFPNHQVATLEFNRPFLILIFKEVSRNLLFMGKVINPNTNL